MTVAHPDTGYTPHPELADPGRLLIDLGFDFDDDDADALDDLDEGFLDNPGHGTGTGSVIVNGGFLGGTGSITGPITINSGGTLAPGTPEARIRE